ncbi:MAG: hypothetical protein QOG21_2211 [Actinomycetota bacterium]|jgi:hypothetical protein|nr:hypothetical protein [Actinomycetota bacterium]
MRNPVSGLHNSGGFRLIGQRRFDAGNDLNLRGIYLTGLAALVGAEGLVIPLCSCVDPGHRSSGSSFLCPRCRSEESSTVGCLGGSG